MAPRTLFRVPWGLVPDDYLPRIIRGADPAAGAEISVSVPRDTIWEVFSIEVTLAAGVAAAAREVSLALDDGINEFARLKMGTNQSANQTIVYTWGLGLVLSNPALAGSPMTIAMLAAPLLPGFRLRTATVNLDAGDNYSAPVLYVAEYQVHHVRSPETSGYYYYFCPACLKTDCGHCAGESCKCLHDYEDANV